MIYVVFEFEKKHAIFVEMFQRVYALFQRRFYEFRVSQLGNTEIQFYVRGVDLRIVQISDKHGLRALKH